MTQYKKNILEGTIAYSDECAIKGCQKRAIQKLKLWLTVKGKRMELGLCDDHFKEECINEELYRMGA